jgi:hypothetical protein
LFRHNGHRDDWFSRFRFRRAARAARGCQKTARKQSNDDRLTDFFHFHIDPSGI